MTPHLSLKKTIRELTPPLLWSLASRIKHRQRKPADEKSPVFPEVLIDQEDLDPLKLYYLSRRFAMTVPLDRLRYFGGLAFNSRQHHFLKYYAEGRKALEHFYNLHQPGHLFSAHFLEIPLTQVKRPTNFQLPWLANIPVGKEDRQRTGEGGLDFSHGHQAYGPVTKQKLDVECDRLDSIVQSIRENGYIPSLSGYPRGYFMIDRSGEWVFLIVGGQHRVAALAHIQVAKVPVCFDPDLPRLIREDDCLNWPLVEKRELTKEDALKIFGAYFRSINEAVY